MTTRQQAADGFYRHLREWFTAFLPRQRGAAQNTITSCRHTWNMLLGYAAGHHRVAVGKVTFAMLDRATVTAFLDHMQATRSWTASTRNQRLACIRSFFTYAAAAEPALAIYLADLAGHPPAQRPGRGTGEVHDHRTRSRRCSPPRTRAPGSGCATSSS